MSHPVLTHIRTTLIAALAAAGCAERDPPRVEPEHSPAGPDMALTGTDMASAEADMGPTEQACDAIEGADGQPSGYAACPGGGVERVGPANCEQGESGECATDDDCFGSEVCICGGIGQQEASACRPSRCDGPDACDTGRCGVAVYHDGCETLHVATCRTADDTCVGNDECSRDQDCWPADNFGSGGPYLGLDHWRCAVPEGFCGRPLRVAGAARRAPAAQGTAAWAAPCHPVAPDAERPALAAHWLHIAALEHASVASFARFSMQLLALGAPADLVADCQRAAADEVEHARLAFGIASAFAGRAMGPGPLDLAGLSLDTDPGAVLREVIIEGCIGETLGALEAFEAARSVADPAIADVCARIAEDELRHAALGWRTARWLLDAHPGLATMACEAFRDGMRRHMDGIDAPDGITARHGIAPRPALRRAAMADVVAQLAARLSSGAG